MVTWIIMDILIQMRQDSLMSYIFADGLYPEFGTKMLIYTSTLPYTHMMMV